MTDEHDPFAGLGNGRMPVREPQRGWRSENGRTGFWVSAGIGALVICAAWLQYGLAGLEEMTDMEEPSGSPSRILMLFGTVPLTVVHGLVVVVLVSMGARFHTRRAVGVALAISAVAVASAVGVVLGQLLFAGCLFAMSAQQTCPAFVP